jgi:hypothetical protein
MREFTKTFMREGKELVIAAIVGGFVWWVTGSKNLAFLAALAGAVTVLFDDQLRRINRTLEAISQKLGRPQV